jgi:hypothetical protein
MPNVPISGLPLTTSVCATALVPIVQNGVTCSTYACLLGSGGGGGGVTQITAGTGVTISPACGLGNVTICSAGGGGLTSVGLTMPSAFCVCGSPLTSNGSLCVSACGTNAQLISGCGSLINAGTGITISGGSICSSGGVMAAGSGSCSIQGSGLNNTASATYSVVSGGACNNACGCSSFVGGGRINIASCNCSFVGGGGCNTACGVKSTISGGYANRSFGVNSTISGGYGNCACGSSSSISGGCLNVSVGNFSSILGGTGNTALCGYTGVFGCNLCNTQPCTFMANNFVVGSFVGCGGCTLALDANGKMCVTSGGGGGGVTQICGGTNVTISPACGTGIVTICSTASGGVSSIVQGTGICISPACGTGAVTICATGGGSSPMVIGSGTCSIVGNGCGNQVCSCFGFVGGGSSNSANYSVYNVVVGGLCNCNKATLGHSFIGGGSFNRIATGFFGGSHNVIVGGKCNSTNSNFYGGIFSGFCNCNSFTCAVFSPGEATFAVTIGGCCNVNTSCFGFIGNGFNNCFQNLFGYNSYGSIVNGFCNKICMACHGVILSGNNNILTGNCTAVLNGNNNNVGGGVVINGNYNIDCAAFNYMGCYNTTCNGCGTISGSCNYTCGAYDGFISGCRNCLCTNSACYSAGCKISFPFVQGNCNFISTGLPTYESIGNAVIFGSCNLICSNCTGASTNHVMVFGCNLIGQNQNTAYFNNLCVCGTLDKVSGSFKIPHPDPIKAECGKFLKHSFVESPTAGDNIYRYNVTTSNCSASIDLPDYYNLLNGNSHVHVSPDAHFGIAYGKINEENNKVNICSNADGDYFVLLVGTRKDKLALDAWNGTEVEANEIKK